MSACTIKAAARLSLSDADWFRFLSLGLEGAKRQGERERVARRKAAGFARRRFVRLTGPGGNIGNLTAHLLLPSVAARAASSTCC